MAEALFVTYFDDHKGQSLLWSRKADTQNLEGIELQALPSGLHLVDADTYHFRRGEPKTTGSDITDGRSQLGTVVFRNRPLSPEEIEKAGGEGNTRGRLMVGLGVLSTIQDTAIMFPLMEPLQLAVDRISREWDVTHTLDDRRDWLDAVLAPLWNTLRGRDGSPSNRTIGVSSGIAESLAVTSDNPIESLVLLSQTLGVSLLSLWKYAAAGRRILFYGSPPLTSICRAAYCTWLASLRLSQLEQRPISVYLGMIGLTDMSSVAAIPHGWVACTSDAIYKDKTGIYDLLVDCSGSEILPSADDEGVNTAREPVMRAVVREKGQASLKYVTYTYSDTVLWNAIAPLLSGETSDDAHRKAPSFIWSTAMGTYTYICDICWGLCSYATGSAYAETEQHEHGGGGYIRLPTDDNAAGRSFADNSEEEDDLDIAESDTTRDNPRIARAIQILKILDHRRDHIEKHLAHTVAETGTPTLSNDDMRHMGLSAWSWVDVEFVRGLHRLRKEPISTGTLGMGFEVEKGWFRRAIGLVGL